MKISIAIATYNEEKNIERCLESIYKWCDEIILVDGSSIDETVVLAKNYKSTIFVLPNNLMFHKNKQLAIDKCTGDWILQLDADEVVSSRLRSEILKAVENTAVNGYWIPRLNFFLGQPLKKGGQFPDYSLRLYRKGKARLPCKSVHEQAELIGESGQLNNYLLHYPYPDFSHYLEHFDRYTTEFSNELEEKEVRINIFSFLSYMIFKPFLWFLLTYFRNKGFMDGFAGFVFSFYSALRFNSSYVKYWERKRKLNNG